MTKDELLAQINRGRREFFSDDPDPFFLRGYRALVDFINDPQVTEAAKRLYGLNRCGNFGVYGGDAQDPYQDQALDAEQWEIVDCEWNRAYEDY